MSRHLVRLYLGHVSGDPVTAPEGSRPPRVFVSFGAAQWKPKVSALAAALEQRGAVVFASGELARVEVREQIRAEIAQSDVMIVLVDAGDERSHWMQEEVRQILLTCWRRPDVRAIVVAPAVGAIPPGLRHQTFVRFIAHDDAHTRRWSSPTVVQEFVDKALGDVGLEQRNVAGHSDEELRRWRNRLVHLGRAEEVDPREVQVIRERLSDGVGVWTAIIDRADVESGTFTVSDTRALLDRAVLAHAIQEPELAQNYYEIVSRVRALSPPDRPDEGANLDYAVGRLALDLGHPEAAAQLLERSVRTTEAYLGTEHPLTIAATHNLALALSKTGDLEEAAKMWARVLQLAESTLGGSHPQTATIAYNLALLQIEQGERSAARELLEKAVAAFDQVRPDDSPEVLETRRQLQALVDSA